MFSLPRKLAQCRIKTVQHRLPIVKIEPSILQEAQCISISDPAGLYITDDYIVTHNTTLSKSIIGEIGNDERLITIEDTLELKIIQPNVVRLLYSKDDLSGTKVSPEDLLQASLRLRPDRVLLQELRDDAAWTYLTSICAGHPGSCTTIHGRDAADAFRRLFLLVKGSEAGRALERETIIELISTAIDVVVPLYRQDGAVNLGAVWFVADRIRAGETAAHIMQAA